MGSLQNKIIIWEQTWSNFQTTSLENEFEANIKQITLYEWNGKIDYSDWSWWLTTYHISVIFEKTFKALRF